MSNGGSAKILGVYRVENETDCHLIELQVKSYTGVLDLVQISQDPDPNRKIPRQVPYYEHLLNADGSVAKELALEPVQVNGEVRLAFFIHFLRPGIPLSSPFGKLSIPPVSDMPARLRVIEYMPPD